MRKIETKESEEKKRKRNHLLIGIILVGLMVLSTGGYAIMNNEGDSSKIVEYKGIKFYSSSGYWGFIYNNQEFSTQYNPEETKDISVKTSAKMTNYNGKVLYFVTESGQPNNEIYRNLYSTILKTNGACLDKEECVGDYPIKDCSTDNVIIIKEPLKNETEEVTQEGNCIFIKAYENNQSKFADAFLFKTLGI